MNELATEKTMTVKEVAEATNIPARTIRDCVQRILPGLAQKGKTTHLTEEQVSLISIEAKKSHNADLAGTRHDVTTDLEMKEKTLEVLSWLTGQVQQEKQLRIEAERKNAILMHVSKTYTATEIAKELNMRSAIELNRKLSALKIQFKQNSTWVLYADYANLGYTEIKQTVLDSGRIIYDRTFTQTGRAFVLDLIGESGIQNQRTKSYAVV